MGEKPLKYREILFQWIWENLEFSCDDLETIKGNSLQIIDPGVANHGAGPDFLNAHIRINGLDWYGSVEIHKRESDWNSHGHEGDAHFNNVVLHVVYEDSRQKRALRKDGTQPPVLVLKPYLAKPLNELFSRKQQSGLPCGNKVTFINQEAFEHQIAAAHREYFTYNTDKILSRYDPSLPVTKAWVKAVVISIYEILGIPANRSQMEKLAKNLFDKQIAKRTDNRTTFVHNIEKEAFSKFSRYEWNHTGMRPASRPKARVSQAASLHYQLLHFPFSKLLEETDECWGKIIELIPMEFRPGSSRLQLAKYLVFLPALYLLGELLHANQIQKRVYTTWLDGAQSVPSEVQHPFREAGFRLTPEVKKLGLAHQYKRYCRSGGCQRCEVFKSAIRS